MADVPSGDSFDVVYYTAPTASSWQALATLALVFDRIHFPGVYVGAEGLDEQGTLVELRRIRSAAAHLDEDDRQMLKLMLVAAQYEHLREFCIFPGAFGLCGTLEPGADRLLTELESLYFGPPPPGFFPTPASGFAKGLPGTKTAGVNAPGWLAYPANAFLYAARRGLPYVNDDPKMPMLGPREVAAKNDPKLLSTILAVECVKLALPSVKPLTSAEQVRELRERTKDEVQPFRRAMLRLTKEVNTAISSESDMEEVVNAAHFVAKTQVEPALEDLRETLRNPGRHWTQRLMDLTAPATILLSASSNFPDMIAKTLAALLIPLGAEALSQRGKTQEVKRSGLHFLLKLSGK